MRSEHANLLYKTKNCYQNRQKKCVNQVTGKIKSTNIQIAQKVIESEKNKAITIFAKKFVTLQAKMINDVMIHASIYRK